MVKEESKARVHACPRCDGMFSRARSRDQHVRTVHEKRKDHACPHCAAAFGTAQNLKTHVRVMHPTPGMQLMTEDGILALMTFD